jgi:sugar phosphate isomerase/epimerase
MGTMPPPPVLLSTSTFFGRPISWTFDLAARSGFEGVEVMVTKEAQSQDPRTIRDLAEDRGLRVGALHAPCLLLTRRVWGTDPVAKTERAIEAAAEAGIPVVVVHPPYRWQRAFRRWLEVELPSIEARTGIAVAVENMFPVRVGRRSVAFHSDHDLDELDGLPHVVLDTSHAAVAGHDPADVLERFGDRLRHVHLSDNAGRGWDSHLPPGEGVLDLEAFLRALASRPYAGSVSLEVDLRPSAEDEVRLVERLGAMREWTMAALDAGAVVRRRG